LESVFDSARAVAGPLASDFFQIEKREALTLARLNRGCQNRESANRPCDNTPARARLRGRGSIRRSFYPSLRRIEKERARLSTALALDDANLP